MEWAVLVGATVVVGVDPHPGTRARLVAIALLAMGIQNATVRRMGVPDVNAPVLTTTLGGLAADVVEVGRRPDRAGRRVATVVLIFIGAALGTVAERHGLVWSSLAALGVATAAMLALLRAGALRSVRL